MSSLDLTIAVLITLVVYWLAEEYAEILGEHLAGGRLPTWRYALAALAATWPMVGASFLPLLLVVLCWLLGAAPSAAANVGLIAAVGELNALRLGRRAGRCGAALGCSSRWPPPLPYSGW